jgi:hypothetical protein
MEMKVLDPHLWDKVLIEWARENLMEDFRWLIRIEADSKHLISRKIFSTSRKI